MSTNISIIRGVYLPDCPQRALQPDIGMPKAFPVKSSRKGFALLVELDCGVIIGQTSFRNY
jgi:hypothetical protein